MICSWPRALRALVSPDPMRLLLSSAAVDPDHIVAAKNGGSPIILGLGEKESFLASDIPAILPYTRKMISLRDGEFAVLSSDQGVELIDSEGLLDRARADRNPVGSSFGGKGRL